MKGLGTMNMSSFLEAWPNVLFFKYAPMSISSKYLEFLGKRYYAEQLRILRKQEQKDWQFFTMGLTHEFANEIQIYSAYTPRIFSFLETLAESNDLSDEIWEKFGKKYKSLALKSGREITDTDLKGLDIYMLTDNARWIYETNEERMMFIQFLQRFASSSKEARETGKIETIYLKPFIEKICERLRRKWKIISTETAEKFQNQEIILRGNCEKIDKAHVAVVRFVLYELLNNALKFSRWTINNRTEYVPVIIEASRQKSFCSVRIITHLNFFPDPDDVTIEENWGYCDNPKCPNKNRTVKRYRPQARISALGYIWQMLCDKCFREEIEITLKFFWEQGEGLGLFMISYLLHSLYFTRYDSGIIEWNEETDKRIVYFEVEFPNDVTVSSIYSKK